MCQDQRFLRDEDGGILPVNNYLRALPYKGNKLLVVSYHVTLGDVLDLVNIGLDIALLATGHTTWGSIFLATDLLLTNDDLMQHHILYLVDKAPNEKGKYVMTRLNDAFMEQLLRDDPVTSWRQSLILGRGVLKSLLHQSEGCCSLRSSQRLQPVALSKARAP